MKHMDNYTIDGNPDEWNSTPSLDINIKNQVLSSPEKWKRPEDGSCTFKAAVSGNNLLISINVVDQQIITNGTNNDKIEIYYRDMNSSERRWYRGGTILLPTQKDNGKIEGLTMRAGRSEIPVNSNIKTYYKTHQNGYIMELLVPFQDLGFDSTPAKGSETGFEVVLTNAVNDDNDVYQIRMSGTGSEVGYRKTVFNRFEME